MHQLTARYLRSCLPVKKQTLAFPQLNWDIEEEGIRFRRCSPHEENQIRRWQETGTNKDTVFKRPTSRYIEGEKLSGIIQLWSDPRGSVAWIDRGGKIYRSIDPIFNDELDEFIEPDFDIEEIVDGNYYKGGKILEYYGGGTYRLGFADGEIETANIRSMRPYTSKVSISSVGDKKRSYQADQHNNKWGIWTPDGFVPIESASDELINIAREKSKNPEAFDAALRIHNEFSRLRKRAPTVEDEMNITESDIEAPFEQLGKRGKAEELAEEIAMWVRQSKLDRVHGGDVKEGKSKSNKRFYGIGFSYPRTLDGTIEVYGPTFIMVKFDHRGQRGNFIAKSPEEFHTEMVSRFGIYMDDEQ